MSVAGIPGLEAARAPDASVGPRQLGQADFLLLLTTQLKSQDPLSPMDNSQFVAQLAQFSTVSGVTEMNGGINRLASILMSEGRNTAPAWLGRMVTGPDGLTDRVERVVLGRDNSVALALAGGGLLPIGQVTEVSSQGSQGDRP